MAVRSSGSEPVQSADEAVPRTCSKAVRMKRHVERPQRPHMLHFSRSEDAPLLRNRVRQREVTGEHLEDGVHAEHGQGAVRGVQSEEGGYRIVGEIGLMAHSCGGHENGYRLVRCHRPYRAARTVCETDPILTGER